MFFAALKSTDSKYIINGDYSVSENGPYGSAALTRVFGGELSCSEEDK